MNFSIRDKFNDVLSNNVVINDAYDLKENAKNMQKGNTNRLLRNLLIGSYCTMVLSFMASVIGYGDSGKYMLVVLVTNFIAVLINNLVFITFLKCTRKESLTLDDSVMYLKKIVTQVLCAILLTLCQTAITTLVLQITILIPTLNVISSIFISLIFTILQALSAYYIFDGETKVRTVLSKAFSIFSHNWRSVLMMSMLFVVWSYVFNVMFTQLLYSHIQQQQGINNIFHSLLQQHDYRNLLYMNLFYLVNYIIAGYLEIKILLGVSLLYNKNVKSSKKDKRVKKHAI